MALIMRITAQPTCFKYRSDESDFCRTPPQKKKSYCTGRNKHPPAEPVVFQFRAVSPNTTSGAQVALMTTWQSCDCYLPPVNGPFLCLTFFSYAFAPLFCSLFLFSRLLFYPCFFFFFFFFCLISYCLFFCSFLFIGKASLEPADYPRVFLYKKQPPDTLSGAGWKARLPNAAICGESICL